MRGWRIHFDVLPGFCQEGVVLWEGGRMDCPPDFDKFVRLWCVSAARTDPGAYGHLMDTLVLDNAAKAGISPAGHRLRIWRRHGGSLLQSPVPVELFKIVKIEEVRHE